MTSPRGWSLRVRLTVGLGAIFLVAGLGMVAAGFLAVANTRTQQLPSAGTIDRLPVGGAVTQDVVDQIIGELDRQRTAALTAVTVQLLLALLAAAVVVVLGAWLVTGRALRPVSVLADTARTVTPATLAARAPDVPGAPELQQLTQDLNAMLDRLEQAFDSQSRFVANASHELRTPLAVQRTILEVEGTEPEATPDLARLCRTLLTVNERHERLVEDLLTLTRGEQPVTEHAAVDLAELARHALGVVPPGDRVVTADLQPALTAGSPGLLDRLVVNLVGNAVQHNEPGGWVTVATHSEPDAATLTVANSGPVVAEHEVAGLLQPFSRGRDRVGAGHGLGLSIAAAVAAGHEGTLVVAPRPDGGLTVTVRLPPP